MPTNPPADRPRLPRLLTAAIATGGLILFGCPQPQTCEMLGTCQPVPSDVTITNGAVQASGATIVSAGQTYDGQTGLAASGLIAVIKDGKSYLWHPALGPANLSDENSAAALEAYFAERLGVGKDSSAARVQPAHAKVSTRSLAIGSPNTLANGLKVTRIDDSHYRFENPTQRWAVVKSTAGPVYLRPRLPP